MEKPGWKTTEFWITFVTTIMALLNQSGVLGTIQLPIESIGAIAAVIITYIFSRTLNKNATLKASAIIAAAQTTAPAQPGGTTAP